MRYFVSYMEATLGMVVYSIAYLAILLLAYTLGYLTAF